MGGRVAASTLSPTDSAQAKKDRRSADAPPTFSPAVAGQERHRRQLRLVHLACDENLIKPNPIR